jgi:1,3-beta-glucan synthase component
MGSCSGFDLVFDYKKNGNYSSMIRIPKGFQPSEKLDDFERYYIQRPGKLVVGMEQQIIHKTNLVPIQICLGEPKAENQCHALAFAMNEVIQTNDMNMYNTLENAFKIPFLLNSLFKTPDGNFHSFGVFIFLFFITIKLNIFFLDFVSVASTVPLYRIVGFPEYIYTWEMSMVGRLMASADFTFVTITQRVLNDLRVRAQYPTNKQKKIIF